jgi:regulator of cell morphogenesis and NO signaling
MAHACGGHGQGAPAAVLDVRDVPPRIRHPKIFETFDALAPGASFVLVNDHDPKPLFYQFQFERAKAFGWRYLEEGPETWRVQITKVAPPLAASQSVADVVAAHPELLETLKSLDVNHCCGAHLTLTEAAASAGIPLDRLLKALGERLAEPAQA